MTLDNFLEDRLFLSLAGTKFPTYINRMASYEKETGNDAIYDMLIYSSFLEGNYSIKRTGEGLELKRIYPEREIVEPERRVINAKIVFPEHYFELIADLNGNPKIQERRINVYPQLEKAAIRNIIEMDCTLKWEDSNGIDAKLIYKKGGFFSWEKLLLEGICIDSTGQILKSKN